jgi:predicted nucleotidyltransferase
MNVRFDLRGHLTPYTLQNIDLATVDEFFVKPFEQTSTTRKKLFANLKNYVDILEKEVASDFELWLNGSFATQKTNPNDIDILLIVPEETYRRHKTNIDQFIGDAIDDNLKLDVYLLLELTKTHPQYNLFVADKAYWLHQFGYSRPNKQHKQHPKGIIQLCFSF